MDNQLDKEYEKTPMTRKPQWQDSSKSKKAPVERKPVASGKRKCGGFVEQ
jgi:hypothetical protein